MRVLIGYDGSPSADAALEGLKRAGLPGETQILVVTVGDIQMLPPNLIRLSGAAFTQRRISATVAQTHNEARQILMESEQLTSKAASRIKSVFPDWQVETAILSGNAAQAITSKAAEWNADLIVVGSQNRSAFGRFFLGSVSGKIVTEAACSVRVARVTGEFDEKAPHRVVAGVDSSRSVHLLVEALARRDLPRDSVVMLVTATIGGFATPTARPDREKIAAREIQKAATAMLRRLGLKVLTTIKDGSAKNVLLAEAGNLYADCIFVASRNIKGTLNRLIHGSVSTDVAANAPFSVEVIR